MAMTYAGELKEGDYIKVPGDPYEWHMIYGVEEDYTSLSGRKVYLKIQGFGGRLVDKTDMFEKRE